jgi:hypothetical protein
LFILTIKLCIRGRFIENIEKSLKIKENGYKNMRGYFLFGIGITKIKKKYCEFG